MAFREIRLFHYRNLEDARIDVDAPEVFLVGENGQGKTNFLESVYLLSYGSSFRAKTESDIIRTGMNDMAVSGKAFVNDDEAEISLKIENGTKRVSIDEKRVNDRKDLIQRMPCIVFCHEDIEFVAGPPERRRWFFNQTMSLLSSLYIDLLRRYNRTIRMRNAVLREGGGELISVYDRQAAGAGMEMQRRRKKTTEEFNRTFTGIFSEVSGFDEPVSIRYSPSWKGCDSEDDAIRRLEEKRGQDEMMRTTTTGPHRDRFVFVQAGRDFTRTASTGQLRLLSLVLRVAQAVFFAGGASKKPILLLDDVLLELDRERRRRFIKSLPEYEQAFFTFLPDERYDIYKSDRTIIYTVKDGRLERMTL